MEEPKRKKRGPITDSLWDYYLTNREIDKKSREDNASRTDKSWTKSEIILLLIIIAGGIGIVLKYFVFK